MVGTFSGALNWKNQWQESILKQWGRVPNWREHVLQSEKQNSNQNSSRKKVRNWNNCKFCGVPSGFPNQDTSYAFVQNPTHQHTLLLSPVTHCSLRQPNITNIPNWSKAPIVCAPPAAHWSLPCIHLLQANTKAVISAHHHLTTLHIGQSAAHCQNKQIGKFDFNIFFWISRWGRTWCFLQRCVLSLLSKTTGGAVG